MILSTIQTFNKSEKEILESKIGENIIFVSNILDPSIEKEKITILITFGSDISNDVLNNFTNLKWIHIFQTGIDHLDINQILKKQILLTNTKNIHGVPISEYVLSMILYKARNIQQYETSKNANLWDRRGILPNEVHGKTVGILGTGLIGQDIASLLKKMGMKTLGINTKGDTRPFFDEIYSMSDKEKVLKQSDFIVLILPATKDTHHCIDKEDFKIMKKSAYLINVGRGTLINTEAFINAIQNHEISGAALDVFDEEPLEMNNLLWSLKNVFITPHIASSTNMYNKRGIDVFSENYSNFIKNIRLNNLIKTESDK